ncbi:MAG TPA: FAD-binding oxidoreductase [Fimbriiglobus sp.]|jgi:glycine/D-amino acid oxidase-like deaminating enzyme|nr:FAD-binding oxidoreductase [Fimbriiglobus sp.]
MTSTDAIVVGQGFAGTAVAWALRWYGHRVTVIDRASDVTASRVAAGLITPITGQRLAKSWQFDELWPAATVFYRRVESELRSPVLHLGPSLRLFADAGEVAVFGRQANRFPELVGPPDPPVVVEAFTAPLGGFQMAPAAWLDATAYLDASRRHFEREGCYLSAKVDPSHDIELAPDWVRLPRLDIRGRWLVFCQGYDAAGNPWLPGMQVHPVQGEILTLRIAGLSERRVVHRGVWLAPRGGDTFLAGSTYDRGRHDSVPTTRGRDEICARVREFLRLPFDVIDHRAAVRPVAPGNRPVFGVNPERPQLGYLNGLGSKGALQAPYFADLLASRLVSTW